jgi:hypothetical protein
MKYLLCLCVGLLVAGCGKPPVVDVQPEAAVTTLQPADMTDLHRQQQEAATLARDELFELLSGRLMAALSDGGPAAAIPVCKTEAPRIAAEVSDKHGLRIGRTSHRLRNPRNAPPDWAQPFVEEEVGEPLFVQLPDDDLGALLPIRLKTPCLMCHGPQESLAPGVAEALRADYPTDRATGFQEGDLRGWFWVEVPGAEEVDPSNSTDASRRDS